MKTESSTTLKDHESNNQLYRTVGLIFIGAGLVYAADQWLKSGWLTLLVLPFLGVMGLALGINYRRLVLSVLGALVSGLGWGIFFLLNNGLGYTHLERVGLLLISLGAGFFGIYGVTQLTAVRGEKTPSTPENKNDRQAVAYWAFVPGGLLVSSGLALWRADFSIYTLVLAGGVSLGLALLAWGGIQRLFGLMIAGCLLLGAALGIFFAWSKGGDFNGLTETGVMLVWFAAGWGLITIASRVVTRGFVWWPLIPGGLLAVVGWGLYIGGNPDNALSFIGNTGSIGLIVFGIYLLLVRRSFRN